jgi:UDP-N-acetylglucosamine--N-acetylmuramyl-(pentapeptide) pyrophosphoryl-undecaprenol N-acetylglucosamine transferase
LKQRRPAAVFSMGGYVAGPAMLAAWLRGIPIVVMEPNAVPGFTNRRMGRVVERALIGFPEAARYFRPGRALLTGLPVRPEFFTLNVKHSGGIPTVLITGGSRGSRTLNNAARGSWELFRIWGQPIRFIHQTGADMFPDLDAAFGSSGLQGEISPFLTDMPRAFYEADLIICRSGAGAVAELGAAGKPSILVPFPFAADQHQLRNAEAMARVGAARLVLDSDLTPQRLFEEVTALIGDSAKLESMARAARQFGKPGAAGKAADILEELAGLTPATQH